MYSWGCSAISIYGFRFLLTSGGGFNLLSLLFRGRQAQPCGRTPCSLIRAWKWSLKGTTEAVLWVRSSQHSIADGGISRAFICLAVGPRCVGSLWAGQVKLECFLISLQSSQPPSFLNCLTAGMWVQASAARDIPQQIKASMLHWWHLLAFGRDSVEGVGFFAVSLGSWGEGVRSLFSSAHYIKGTIKI